MTSLHSVRSYGSDQQEHGNHHSMAEDFFTEDSFYCFSSSLPTIYGVTSISDAGFTDTLIVALIKGSIMSYGFKKSGPSYVNAECCELIFKSLPADSTFTAIDCMRYGDKGLAVALSFCKESSGKQTHILNIYDKTCSDSDNSALDSMENCVSFDLGINPPFQITHCQTKPRNATNELLVPVFLLLGGDCQIHVYSHNLDDNEFCESSLNDFFPEFKNISSAALWVDIKITSSGKKRISALGEASGEVSVYVTDLTSPDWTVVSHQIQCDSPITCVRLFSRYSSSPKPDFFTSKVNFEVESVSQEPCHLLVTCARESAVIYCYCGEQGFQFPVLLEQSSNFDCVTCCDIADVNRDGRNNIIIGTYGHQILVYPFDIPGPPSTNEVCPCCPSSVYPMWSKSVCCPVISIKFLDINCDGLKEMVVVSAKGVHILHCDTKTAIDECIQKLEWLRKFGIR